LRLRGYSSRDGQPAILSPVSVYAEWFRTSALRKANRAAGGEFDREHVTRYIYSHPKKFDVRLMPAPAAIDREDVRLTVDIEEDWITPWPFTRRWGRNGLIGNASPACWTTSPPCAAAWRCSIAPIEAGRRRRAVDFCDAQQYR